MSPVKMENGVGCGLALELPIALAMALLVEVSCDVVLDMLVDDDASEVLRFFASSRGTYGPPARLQRTP